jgi:putative acetyltransferase
MLAIRQEISEDIDAISELNKQAFGSNSEANLVDKLRNRQAIVISLVAVLGNKIVGHILFSQVIIEGEQGNFNAIGLAPMSVLPAYQKMSIGSQLIESGTEEIRRLGYEIIVVLGHPNYYPRFGFIRADQRGIKWEHEAPLEAFMILELHEGALRGRRGVVKFQPEFDGV